MVEQPHPGTQRLALVAGGSGLIGRQLLAQMVERSDLKALALLRKPLAPTMRGVEQQLVDFEHLADVALPSASVAFSCLGTTAAVAGSPAAFHHVDHDMVMAFATAALKAGASCLVHVSASGASAQSRIYYSRVKAETEKALAGLGFTSLIVLRPSLLLGDRAALNQPKRAAEGLSQSLAPILAPLLPLSLRPITAFAVARAMLAYGLAAPAGEHIIGNATLHSR